MTLGLQPVGQPWSISASKLHFPFGQNFEHSTSSFMQSTFAKRQFEFVVFVSYIVYYILYCDILSVLQNIFSLFYQLIECWSSFAISWCRWNWSHDKDYILILVDLLCHINKNPNPNSEPVSGFQNLLKKCCSLRQNFPTKRVASIRPT